MLMRCSETKRSEFVRIPRFEKYHAVKISLKKYDEFLAGTGKIRADNCNYNCKPKKQETAAAPP